MSCETSLSHRITEDRALDQGRFGRCGGRGELTLWSRPRGSSMTVRCGTCDGTGIERKDGAR